MNSLKLFGKKSVLSFMVLMTVSLMGGASISWGMEADTDTKIEGTSSEFQPLPYFSLKGVRGHKESHFLYDINGGLISIDVVSKDFVETKFHDLPRELQTQIKEKNRDLLEDYKLEDEYSAQIINPPSPPVQNPSGNLEEGEGNSIPENLPFYKGEKDLNDDEARKLMDKEERKKKKEELQRAMKGEGNKEETPQTRQSPSNLKGIISLAAGLGAAMGGVLIMDYFFGKKVQTYVASWMAKPQALAHASGERVHKISLVSSFKTFWTPQRVGMGARVAVDIMGGGMTGMAVWAALSYFL